MSNPGHTTSVGNENDSSPSSQQATGGNGGAQLTQSNAETRADPASAKPAERRQAGSDATAINRTAQDTRPEQAGSTGTGLGAAETGGNQDEFDMPKE